MLFRSYDLSNLCGQAHKHTPFPLNQLYLRGSSGIEVLTVSVKPSGHIYPSKPAVGPPRLGVMVGGQFWLDEIFRNTPHSPLYLACSSPGIQYVWHCSYIFGTPAEQTTALSTQAPEEPASTSVLTHHPRCSQDLTVSLNFDACAVRATEKMPFHGFIAYELQAEYGRSDTRPLITVLMKIIIAIHSSW